MIFLKLKSDTSHMSHKSVSGVCMTGGLRRLTCLDQVRVERMWAHLCDSSIDMSLLST